VIGRTVTVDVDRPLGSRHPEYPELFYPVNYGYIPGILAGDGEEQDAYILGVEEPVRTFTGRVIAVIHRLDDAEDKWVLAPAGSVYTAEQIAAATAFQERYFRTWIEI
jgi:inorganic pyrophosphatase